MHLSNMGTERHNHCRDEMELSQKELKKIYHVLKTYDEGLLINPSEPWENDYYDEPLVDKTGLKPLLKKIESLLPKEEANNAKKDILRRRYDSFNNQIDEAVYRKIEKAFNGLTTLQIGYFDMESGEAIKRDIDIYYKNSKYAIAYCHLRKAIRKFRVSRIVSAKNISSTYKIPNDFDKKKYL